MDPTRFDSISKLFARRKTRRAAIAGGVGLTAAAVAPLASRTAAQDATPEVATPAVDPTNPHPSADEAQVDPKFLFVQPFDAGTWAPKAGEDGVYTLTLTGAAANTVYFSDRPERIVGLSPTQDFLDGLGFTPDFPPNAAIVAPHEDGEGQEILVIELFAPVYDANAETLTYDATVLADYGEHGLAHLANQQQDYELGETFGAGGLFIDGCAGGIYECRDPEIGYIVGRVTTPLCWRQNHCLSCHDPAIECASAYPDNCGGSEPCGVVLVGCTKGGQTLDCP